MTNSDSRQGSPAGPGAAARQGVGTDSGPRRAGVRTNATKAVLDFVCDEFRSQRPVGLRWMLDVWWSGRGRHSWRRSFDHCPWAHAWAAEGRAMDILLQAMDLHAPEDPQP